MRMYVIVIVYECRSEGMGVRSPKDKHKKGEARNRPGKREKENIKHETPVNRTKRERTLFSLFF